MQNNKLKASLIALSFGLGLGLSSTTMAAWWPSAQQCAAMEAACMATDDEELCQEWMSYYSYCRSLG